MKGKKGLAVILRDGIDSMIADIRARVEFFLRRLDTFTEEDLDLWETQVRQAVNDQMEFLRGKMHEYIQKP